MIARAFIANKDTKTPMRIGFTSLLLFTLLAVCLMGPPHAVGFAAEAVVTVQTFICKYIPLPFDLGHVGIALASSISSLLSFSVILGVLVVRSKDLMLNPFLLSTVKASVATVVSIGVTHFVSRSLSFDSGAISLALGGASAFTTWFITSLLLATAEAKEVLQILRRRVANLQRP